MFSPDLLFNDLSDLPPQVELESTTVLKAAIEVSRTLAELKGREDLIPNQNILLNVLTLQEAQLSSEIEGIVTTIDQLYRALILPANLTENPHAKVVLRYRDALWYGVNKMREDYPLSTMLYVNMVQIIKGHTIGIRKVLGTKLQDQRSENIIYTPPEGEELPRKRLHKLDQFIPTNNGIDPLIKLVLIHCQFEAIHPVSDGNGRTGRILNILYLLHQGLMTEPVLYLSRYIISHKDDYYRLLKEVTEKGAWESWILFMLKSISVTSKHTLNQIIAIYQLMNQYANRVQENYLKSTQKNWSKSCLNDLIAKVNFWLTRKCQTTNCFQVPQIT